MSNRFRAVALVLRSYISDTYMLLEAADEVVSLIETEAAAVEPFVIKSPDGHAIFDWTTRLWNYDHAYLVGVARGDDELLMHLSNTKKISAIKRLRTIVPGATLKACKEAVEDNLVGIAASLRPDPWNSIPRDCESDF